MLVGDVLVAAVAECVDEVSATCQAASDNTKPRPSFRKYIPVPYESLVSRMAPRIVHDRVDRSEWIRVQLAVDPGRRRLVPGSQEEESAIHRVHSDPSLVSVGSTTVDWRRTAEEENDDDDDEIDWTAVSPELNALCRSRRATRGRDRQRTL